MRMPKSLSAHTKSQIEQSGTHSLGGPDRLDNFLRPQSMILAREDHTAKTTRPTPHDF